MDYSKLSTSTLEALSSGQKLDYSKLSDDELSELSKIAKPPQESTQKHIQQDEIANTDEPGKLESLVRGAAQGGTLGFADEIAGGGQALLDQLTGSPLSLGDSYKLHRDESRAAYDQAEQANPGTYLAGNLAGGLASGVVMPIGSSANFGKAMLTAGKLGAIGGLGASEADSAYGMVKDTALGGVIGSSVGGLLHGAGKGLSALAETNPGRAYQEGRAGINLVGKQARQDIGDDVVKFAGETGENIQNRLKQEAIEKNALLKAADESGQKIDVTDFLNKTYPEEAAKLPKSYTSEGDAARRGLAEPFTRAEGNLPPEDEFSKLLNDTYSNPKTTSTNAAPQKVEMSPSEIDAFRSALGSLGFEKKLSDRQVVALSKRLSGKVSDFAGKEIEGLGAKNENIQNLLDAQDIFNIGNGLDEFGSQKKLTPLLQRLDSDSLSSDIARSQLKHGIAALNEVDPVLAKNIESKGTALSERYTLAKNINKPISFTGNPIEMAGRISGKTSNLIGQGVNKVANTIPGKIISTAFNSTPEYINNLAVQLEAKNNSFAPLLRNIANQTEPKRKALMFSLMQQPGFRELFKNNSDTEN
jgi:hypothetical protein